MIKIGNNIDMSNYYKPQLQNKKIEDVGCNEKISETDGVTVCISIEGRNNQEAMTEKDDGLEKIEEEGTSEKETESVSRSIGVNAGKLARKIAAAKTTSQLRMVIAEIKSDMQEVKAGLESGMCDETELKKVENLMAMAQNKMGQVEDREPTAEEENAFALASLM